MAPVFLADLHVNQNSDIGQFWAGNLWVDASGMDLLIV